jgi:Fe-S cluster assembly scaffold protein SufB
MEKIDMKVNRLPAPTWNWLKMNGTVVSGVQASREGHCRSTLPDGWATAENELQDIATGIGPDLDRLFERSGVKTRTFTALNTVSDPLRLDFSYGAGASDLNAVDIDAAEGCELSIFMDYSAVTGADGTAGVRTRVKLGRNSRVHLIQVQRLSEKMTFFNAVGLKCAEGARADLTQIVFGGGKTYMGTLCALEGTGSAFCSDIGYTLGGTQRLDMNSTALHRGRKTESRINASGVLRGEAFKLFRGTIDFRRGSAQAVGNEKEDVLLMDDRVVNQTIPLILCEEEDVEGNHGATIGRLDDALLFYMQSRGLTREQVYEMMSRARIAAVCAKIPDAVLRGEIEKYLEGGDGDDR